ncbi:MULTISPECIES: hypothetical protein [unclassified Roseitalea]|uniref:hypothetical protein n=1 Tax=unclassified Roseitalea TaxID=2639107 RepID=UPI00273FFF78|nr:MULTISPECIES: hypothetical protein [unclassified Roseitalea]
MGAMQVRVRSPDLSPGKRVGRAHADTGAGRIIGVDEDDACPFHYQPDLLQGLGPAGWDIVEAFEPIDCIPRNAGAATEFGRTPVEKGTSRADLSTSDQIFAILYLQIAKLHLQTGDILWISGCTKA